MAQSNQEGIKLNKNFRTKMILINFLIDLVFICIESIVFFMWTIFRWSLLCIFQSITIYNVDIGQSLTTLTTCRCLIRDDVIFFHQITLLQFCGRYHLRDSYFSRFPKKKEVGEIGTWATQTPCVRATSRPRRPPFDSFV